LNGLPSGVEVVTPNAVIPAGQNSIKLQLKAAADAPVGEHQVKIDAKAPLKDPATYVTVGKPLPRPGDRTKKRLEQVQQPVSGLRGVLRTIGQGVKPRGW
jgi:hypothetical protein